MRLYTYIRGVRKGIRIKIYQLEYLIILNYKKEKIKMKTITVY